MWATSSSHNSRHSSGTGDVKELRIAATRMWSRDIPNLFYLHKYVKLKIGDRACRSNLLLRNAIGYPCRNREGKCHAIIGPTYILLYTGNLLIVSSRENVVCQDGIFIVGKISGIPLTFA